MFEVVNSKQNCQPAATCVPTLPCFGVVFVANVLFMDENKVKVKLRGQYDHYGASSFLFM